MADLSSRFQLTEAASHFLYTSFQHLAISLRLECAGIIFEKEIQSIDPPEDWEGPNLSNSESDLLDLDEDILPEETLDKLAAAWDDAQSRASSGEVTVPIDHTIKRVEIASHILNLYSVVETVVNRHLYTEKKPAGSTMGFIKAWIVPGCFQKWSTCSRSKYPRGSFV